MSEVTVHHYFKRFCEDGIWRRIHYSIAEAAIGEARRQPSFAIIDSQSVKTGPDARLDVG